MTIVTFHRLLPSELQHLGNNLSEAVRLDHEELAADRSLASLNEAVDWDNDLGGATPCD